MFPFGVKRRECRVVSLVIPAASLVLVDSASQEAFYALNSLRALALGGVVVWEAY